MNQSTTRALSGKALLAGGALLFLIGMVAFVLKVKSGLMLFEYGDESEKFVAAQMLAHGQRLYSDIFAHHGPLPYILAHLYVRFVSPGDFTLIRLSMAVFALFSCAALVFSPVLRSNLARVWAAGVYLVLLSIVWLMQGIHMVLYEQIGGFLLAVPLLQLVLPALFGLRPSATGSFLSGVAITLACFTTYAFGPPAILMLGATLVCFPRESALRELKTVGAPMAIGMLATAAVIFGWILLYADLKGFFVYHFYFNQKVYLKFVSYSPKKLLDLLTFSFAPKASIHSFALILMALWAYFLTTVTSDRKTLSVRASRAVSVVLSIGSVLLMNPRGDAGFHDSGFVVANLILFAVAWALFLQQRVESEMPRGIGGALLMMFALVFVLTRISNEAISSHGFPKSELRIHVVQMKQQEGGPYDIVRSVAGKDGRILVLIFNPGQYIKTGLLPASGNYYYLPWQAEYDRNPKLGFKIDICSDIQKNAPAAIWFDNWRVWSRYSIEDYEPCVPALISTRYARLSGDPRWFIRKDLVARTSVATH